MIKHASTELVRVVGSNLDIYGRRGKEGPFHQELTRRRSNNCNLMVTEAEVVCLYTRARAMPCKGTINEQTCNQHSPAMIVPIKEGNTGDHSNSGSIIGEPSILNVSIRMVRRRKNTTSDMTPTSVRRDSGILEANGFTARPGIRCNVRYDHKYIFRDRDSSEVIHQPEA